MRALRDSPDAFCATYEAALKRTEDSWREQLHSTVSGCDRNTQLAFDGDSCVGIAALFREPKSPTGDIIMMWIDPIHRGSVAATLLVAKLIKWAREFGFESVALNVTDTNTRAIKFYQNQGFIPTGNAVDIDSERGLRGIRMAMQLN